jgi:HEAT repeat protein
MALVRRRFGPVFYITTIVALVVAISIPFWPTAIEQWRAWRLSRQLRDPSEAVRREAAQGLVQLGPATTPYVTWAMRDPNPQVRLLACSILPRIAHDRPDRTLDALLAVLKDSNVSVRCAAVISVGCRR